MRTTCDLQATLREDVTTYPDGAAFLLHEGETYAIERVGNGGVYVLTPFGEAFVAYRSIRWHAEADVWPGMAEVAG